MHGMYVYMHRSEEALDVLICRDLLNHLRLDEAQRVLANLLLSHTPTLIISNNRDASANEELQDDHGPNSRKLDIERSPFGWPKAREGNGHLWLWQRHRVKAATKHNTSWWTGRLERARGGERQ